MIALINRLSKVECCESLKPNGESICALGPNCGNRLFEKRAYAKVGYKMSAMDMERDRQREKERER